MVALPFLEWFRASRLSEKPWLILGKGPTFSRHAQLDLSEYRLLSLNHVVRELPVHLSHIIDVDVVAACGDALPQNAEAVVMPWYPHEGNRAGQRTLDDLARQLPTLAILAEQGRLLWYDLSTASVRRGPGPVVVATYFSAEAALALLALAGVSRIRSLGVDGGADYSSEFDDLRQRTLLANRQPTFDLQFAGFARTIMATAVDYAPLGIETPIRVYVGSQDAQMLAVQVLEYSIRKHCSMSVRVFPLHLNDIEVPVPKDPSNRPRTPFSFQRFLIPQMAGSRGRAIYLDSDMQVFRDIRQLWTLPFDGADLLRVGDAESSGRRPQFSVMLLDCERLGWNIAEIVAGLDDGTLTYESLMYNMAVARKVRPTIGPEWNSLERYEEGRTALLHYTDMDTQPWVSLDNDNGHLWVRDLIEAVRSGSIAREFVVEQVARGFVRPSLLYQVDHGVEECALLPSAARRLDADFVPPFKSIAGHGGIRRRLLAVLRAVARRVYERSGLRRVRRRLRRGPDGRTGGR